MKSIIDFFKSLFHSIKKSFLEAPPQMRKGIIAFLSSALLIILVVTSVKSILVKREAATRAAEIEAGPLVKTATVAPSPGEHTITLIGETRPFAEATLYAKVSGYLKTVNVDKGDVVKKGQVLAVIDSAETDQAFQAARAESKYKQAIAARIDKLFTKHLVSQQEVDQARADADEASARLHGQETLKSYETIRAPFAGTITARFADPGALVQNCNELSGKCTSDRNCIND
jgi:membrane fusion protein (multidrug efflux system)